MASREEEKRKRREEREAAEAAHAASAKRTRNLQFLLGALLTIAVVVVAVLLITGSGDDNGSDEAKTPTENASTAQIPKLVEADLDKAAKAADCVLLNPAIEGDSHVEDKVEYKTNPPTSGNHNPVPALDGEYDAGQEPDSENLVHALEHGRINLQYKPGLPANQVEQLRAVFGEELNGLAGYKTLLYQNNTDMTYAVAATAWGHILGCKTFNDKIFDAIRDFRVKYVDKGPEPGIPPTNQ